MVVCEGPPSYYSSCTIMTHAVQLLASSPPKKMAADKPKPKPPPPSHPHPSLLRSATSIPPPPPSGVQMAPAFPQHQQYSSMPVQQHTPMQPANQPAHLCMANQPLQQNMQQSAGGNQPHYSQQGFCTAPATTPVRPHLVPDLFDLLSTPVVSASLKSPTLRYLRIAVALWTQDLKSPCVFAPENCLPLICVQTATDISALLEHNSMYQRISLAEPERLHERVRTFFSFKTAFITKTERGPPSCTVTPMCVPAPYA